MDLDIWCVLDAFFGEEDGSSFGEIDRNPPLFKPGLDKDDFILEIRNCRGI